MVAGRVLGAKLHGSRVPWGCTWLSLEFLYFFFESMYIYIHELWIIHVPIMIWFAISLAKWTLHYSRQSELVNFIEVQTSWGNLGHSPDRAGGAGQPGTVSSTLKRSTKCAEIWRYRCLTLERPTFTIWIAGVSLQLGVVCRSSMWYPPSVVNVAYWKGGELSNISMLVYTKIVWFTLILYIPR